MHVDADGRYALEVPRDSDTTLEITSPGQIPVRLQTVRLRADVQAPNVSTLSQTAFDDLSALGPGLSGSVLLVQVLTMGTCDLGGAHLRTTPETGTTIYAGSDGQPDPTLTSMSSGVPIAYIVDVSGTVTPSVTNITPPCAPLEFPVVTPSITYQGPITTADQTAALVYLFAMP
jgi:hypothetical protein